MGKSKIQNRKPTIGSGLHQKHHEEDSPRDPRESSRPSRTSLLESIPDFQQDDRREECGDDDGDHGEWIERASEHALIPPSHPHGDGWAVEEHEMEDVDDERSTPREAEKLRAVRAKHHYRMRDRENDEKSADAEDDMLRAREPELIVRRIGVKKPVEREAGAREEASRKEEKGDAAPRSSRRDAPPGEREAEHEICERWEEREGGRRLRREVEPDRERKRCVDAARPEIGCRDNARDADQERRPLAPLQPAEHTCERDDEKTAEGDHLKDVRIEETSQLLRALLDDELA